MYVIEAVVETTDECTRDEAVAAAQAAEQALGMTITSVPFLDNVTVRVIDEAGESVAYDAAAEG